MSRASLGILLLIGTIGFYWMSIQNADSDIVIKTGTAIAITTIEPTYITTDYSVSFSIAGDFMFARGVHRKFNNNPIASLGKIGNNLFGKTDANIVNLEGAISAESRQEVAKRGSFKFIFPNTVIDVLKEYDINVVSLANNHSFDNGKSGFIKTQELLEENNIQHFGGYTSEYAPNVAVVKGTNLNLIIIGVHTLYESPDITDIIKRYKKDKSNKVLIMPHWGIEYEFKHSQRQEDFAYSWVDAGADIIIGAHPHTVQDVEVYKGVPIVYSLGNFLFDQTEQNTGEKGVQDGMVLYGKFIKDKLAIYAVPIRLEDFQPNLIKDKIKEAKILKSFYKPWSKYEQDINGIKMFVFKYSDN